MLDMITDPACLPWVLVALPGFVVAIGLLAIVAYTLLADARKDRARRDSVNVAIAQACTTVGGAPQAPSTPTTRVVRKLRLVGPPQESPEVLAGMCEDLDCPMCDYDLGGES